MHDIDKTDISEWYQQNGETILKYTLMMVRDYQYAEDLTQKTFVKAYKSRSSFHGNADPRPWLFSIAQNTTIDFLRKQKWTEK